MSDDLALLAADLDTLNQQLADINPELVALAENIEEVQLSFQGVQDSIPQFFKTIKAVVGVVLGLLIFTQLPSIYFGYLLTNGAIF